MNKNAKQIPVLQLEDDTFRFVGSLILLAVFVGFFGWSYLAPLDAASPAPGKVVVKGELKVIQHLEGGILADLFVRQGDRVEKNQILARLDVTQVQANLDVLFSQLITVKAKVARLEAERDGLSVIDWSQIMQTEAIEEATAVIDEQQTLFEKRRRSISGEIEILERSIEQLNSKIASIIKSKATQTELLDSFESELAKLKKLLEQGFVDESRVTDLTRKIVEIKGNIQQLQSELKATEIEIGDIRLKVIQKQAVYDTDVQNQLAELQSKRIQVEEQLRVAKDKRSRAEIKSPASGVVLEVDVTTIGGVVGSARPFITIVPEDETLVIEAQVNPVDVDRVKQGQVAEIQVAAFDMSKMPKVYATVVSVSPDALSDKTGGRSYYKAILEISDEELSKFKMSRLIPGMPVTALIKTGERTLWDYLMKPLRKGIDGALLER